VRHAALLLVASLIAAPVIAQPSLAPAPADLLARIGQYVEEYFRSARTIVSRETIRLQPVNGTMAPRESPRVLVYELRVESDPGNVLPSMTRRLVKASGDIAPTRADSECFDPPDVSIDPLARLLPERQKEFTFSVRRGSSSRVIEIDFTPVLRRAPVVMWAGNCARVDIDGSTRGRIWVEAGTGAVVRAEERLDKPFSFVSPPATGGNRLPIQQSLEQFESSVRYEPVRFRDPDEIVMLPKSARTLTVFYNGGVPRLLTVQSFDKYQRFVTGGRVVK
jgi:hypothetical protein